MRQAEQQPAVNRRAANPPQATAGQHRGPPDRQAHAHSLPQHDWGPPRDAEPASSDVRRDAPEFAAIKQRQQAAWSAGNDAVIGTTLQIVGENLCEALDVRAGQRVLDLAAGNGNATLAAARRWCEVGFAYRLCPATARTGAGAGAGRRACRRLPRGRCRGTPIPRRELRRGGLHLRSHVRAEPPSAPRQRWSACARRAAGSGLRTGRPKASSGRSSGF